jgi:O-antigen/teichoic acid export membrane protein
VAALTAVLQLLFVLGSVVIMAVAGVDPPIIPLGSLALGQAAAGIAGLRLVHYRRVAPVDLQLSWLKLIRSGRWLLIAGLVPAGATFVGAALVSRLAGVDELGFAQAAHVAARPVLILATGLAAVLGFRLMEAGAARSRERGSRFWRLYSLLVAGGAVAYAALVGFDWVGNPLAAILPRAYEVGGLVVVTIVANLVAALIKPPRDELIGARFEPRVASIDSTAALAIVAMALLAGPLQAFAVPLGILASSLIQVAAYLPARRALYDGRLSSWTTANNEVPS